LGQLLFAAAGATSYGHEYTRQALHDPANGFAPGATLSHFRREPCRQPVIVAPSVTFRQDRAPGSRRFSVELDYSGPTHTAAASFAQDSRDDVLFRGTCCSPTTRDHDRRRCQLHWCQVLPYLQSTAPRTIIPGHGPTSSVPSLQCDGRIPSRVDERGHPPVYPAAAADADAIAQELSLRLPSPPRADSLSSSRPTCA